MKKKLTILIFGSIYLVFLAVGFYTARLHNTGTAAPTPLSARQDNWILVRVSDMTEDRPQLVSVWAMFVSYTPGPQIFFKPLYTLDTTNPAAVQLGRMFTVSANRQISDKFYQALDRFNIDRTGLVILDDTGMKTFSSWFFPTKNDGTDSSLIPVTSLHTNPEATLYERVCNSLTNSNTLSLDQFQWQNVVPNHILPYPGLDALVDTWGKILKSNLPAHCEVIPAA